MELRVTARPQRYVPQKAVEARDEDLLLVEGAAALEIVRVEEQPVVVGVHQNRGEAVAALNAERDAY